MEDKFQERSHKTQKSTKKMRNLRKRSAKKPKRLNAQMTTLQPHGENFSATNNSVRNRSSSFSCKQTLYRSIAKANLHCLKSPNKKVEIIQRLTTKCKLRMNLKEN